MKYLTALAFIAAFCLAWPLRAQEQICDPHENIIAFLEAAGEHRAAGGITNNGSLVEIYTSPRGTWSILITEPGEDTCFVEAGNEWTGELMYQKADHHYRPPHSWISPKTNGQIGCCGPDDIAEIPLWEASQVSVGGSITAMFPGGERTVEVRKIYPTQDGKAYITRFGCLFRTFGI